MDLTVFANGANRNVSGVTDATTCSQIVYVLAHATNQKGRFVLVAKFNGSEYRLSQNEKPLEIIKKSQSEGYQATFELRQLPSGAGPPIAPKPSPISHSNSFDAEIHSITSKSNFLPMSHPTSASTSSLPPNPQPKPIISHHMSFPVLKRNQPRPPPPSYDEVIGQKYNSLSRESAKSFVSALNAPPNSSAHTPSELSLSSLSEDALASLGQEELEKLIERQAIIIASQKMQILAMESSFENKEELELLQIKKQDQNLQMVLDKLKVENWPKQYDIAKKENEHLELQKAQLLSIKETRKRELEETLTLQQRLEAELEALKMDEEEPVDSYQYPPPDFDPTAQIRQDHPLDYSMS